MSEKRNISPVLALVCAVLALILSVLSLAAGRPGPDQSNENPALEEQIQQLQAQVAALTARLEAMDGENTLADWTLTAVSWSDGAGADVTLAAVPEQPGENTVLTFRVTLDGSEVASQVCAPENGIFTATVSLPAAEGYHYDCILSDGGNSRYFDLSSPENPVLCDLVYLQSSLTAYCDLHIESWEPGDGMLVLTNAVGQVQLSRISPETAPSVEAAELILTHNGEEIARAALEPLAGEEAGLFLLPADGTEFSLPPIAGGDVLELTLSVTLSDGRTLTAFGANWYHADGELNLVVG